LKDTYRDLIDEAVFNVETGTSDYQSAMRGIINQLADSGVKVHEEKVGYPSGYNRRIDSSVRQNVLTGVRQVNITTQKIVGREFGADGVEISAHSPCAEDHLHLQGKQFSNKEFKKLNASLERPIGEYNCRHFVFSIVLGVNKPSYSDKMLNQMNRESQSVIEYEGKKYTSYEATQVQRKLETEIRKQKEPKDTPSALDNMYLYLGCFSFSLFYFHKLVEIAYPLYTESFIGLGIYVDELAVIVNVKVLTGSYGECADLLGRGGEVDLLTVYHALKSEYVLVDVCLALTCKLVHKSVLTATSKSYLGFDVTAFYLE
jgi:hypothetical protein